MQNQRFGKYDNFTVCWSVFRSKRWKFRLCTVWPFKIIHLRHTMCLKYLLMGSGVKCLPIRQVTAPASIAIPIAIHGIHTCISHTPTRPCVRVCVHIQKLTHRYIIPEINLSRAILIVINWTCMCLRMAASVVSELCLFVFVRHMCV